MTCKKSTFMLYLKEHLFFDDQKGCKKDFGKKDIKRHRVRCVCAAADTLRIAYYCVVAFRCEGHGGYFRI